MMLTRVLPNGSRLALVAVVLLSPGELGCGKRGLDPIQDAPPLERLSFWPHVYYGVSPPEGVVWIDALVTDPGFRASPASNFPLEVRTSAGDIEIASLRQAICGPNLDGRVWACDRIAVSMLDGYSVLDLYEHIKGMDARFYSVSPLLVTAGVQLFGTSLDDAVRRAKTWPGVKNATYSGIAFLGVEGIETEIPRALHAAIKLDIRNPAVRNGVLEAMEGDTITARYIQPDGSVLAREWILPRQPPG